MILKLVRLNPLLHNAQGMMLDEQTIPTHEYIINRLNDYGLAYYSFNLVFTDVSEVPLQ
jgi:N-ethylmaleimide reductase